MDCVRSDKPTVEDDTAGLSSKIQALLRDLPLGEHAVVFSASREGSLHLNTVFKAKGIDCFGLYTGQDTTVTEHAVSSWGSHPIDASKAGPVLVVQAGAAASGLTLTAASKMFLMEPFSRQEEEHQAYARCHRYGQKQDVHVRIYYAPVSVESRLLRWRNRSVDDKMAAAGNTFSQLFEEEGEDSDADDGYNDTLNMEMRGDSKNDDNDESNSEGDRDGDSSELAEDNLRTQFLLGLVDEDGNPTGEVPTVGGRQDAVDAMAPARRFVMD